MTEIWDEKAALLRDTRGLLHNEDYWRFLVRDVWRIDRAPVRLVDFGCGYGWAGAFLLPMLAEGSSYTGLDRSAPLLEQARTLFAGLPYPATFIESDAHRVPLPDAAFDVAIAHTVLMHLPQPERALGEMIRVTRDGGLVIAVDANRNAINALVHVTETDEQDRTPLSFFQAMNASVRRRTGVDYNIGMRTPVLMHKAGLVDVDARVSDAVRHSFPPVDTPEKAQRLRALLAGGLGGYPTDAVSFEQAVDQLVSRGADPDAAAAELRREMTTDYRETLAGYHVVQPGLMTISYGRVRRR